MGNIFQKVTCSWILISLWLFACSELNAACSPVCKYYLTVDALYWKPMHCPIFVATRFVTTLNTPRPRDELYLTGDYNPGVRIRLGYRMCDWFSDLSYLCFHSTENVSKQRDNFTNMMIAGENGTTVPVGVIAAESSATFRYQNVEGRFGYCFCFKQNFLTFLYGNVRWVKIDFKNLTQGPSQNDPSFFDFFKQHSNFNGGGFGVGIGGRYRLCRGLGLHGATDIMAIIGETQLKNFSSINRDQVGGFRQNFLDRPEKWNQILPAFTFRLGIDYLFCWCRYEFQAAIGYELDYYSQVLRYASGNAAPGTGDSRDITPLFSCQDVGFAGPYFNLSVKF